MARSDCLQHYGWSSVTTFEGITYNMTGELSIDPALLPTGALEVTEQDERSNSRHRVWSVHLSQSGAEQGH